MKIKLREVASVIRSKNAGPFELTLDIMFKDEGVFDQFYKANVITPELIAELYQTSVENVIGVFYFSNARAIKATIIRPYPSGALCERDVYGAQQHAPLMNTVVDLPD